MTAIATPMFIQVGARRYQVASFQQASQMYCRARDACGHGASNVPTAPIVDEHGREIAHVSYNGRVWPGRRGRPGDPGDWTPDTKPLYDNRVA